MPLQQWPARSTPLARRETLTPLRAWRAPLASSGLPPLFYCWKCPAPAPLGLPRPLPAPAPPLPRVLPQDSRRLPAHQLRRCRQGVAGGEARSPTASSAAPQAETADTTAQSALRAPFQMPPHQGRAPIAPQGPTLKLAGPPRAYPAPWERTAAGSGGRVLCAHPKLASAVSRRAATRWPMAGRALLGQLGQAESAAPAATPAPQTARQSPAPRAPTALALAP